MLSRHNVLYMALIILVLLSIFAPPLLADEDEARTILSASKIKEPITIDGLANEPAWQKTPHLKTNVRSGSIGDIEATLHALYDDDYFYLHVEWPDPTMSASKNQWLRTDEGWSKGNDEDRFSIIWNIDDSVKGFNIAGCAMLCHGDRMFTNDADERADVWHWKAGRTNPVGYADDQFMNSIVVEEDSPAHAEWTGRHSDPKSSGGYISNKNSKGTGPRYYEPDPLDDEDGLFITKDEIDSGEAVELLPGTTLPPGTTVPGYILEKPVGSRGDIQAAGVWKDGKWSLELKRKLATNTSDDVHFDISDTYRFGIAIMDNSAGFAGYGKGHSFDLGARTLEFGGLNSEVLTDLVLIKNYLVASNYYAINGDKGLSISSIEDSLTIYKGLGIQIATLDPLLHTRIVSSFVEARRRPDQKNIEYLIDEIDLASLTVQGKREPTNPSLGLKILALWGNVQAYVFVMLALFVIYPLYKTYQTSRNPELKHLGIFLFTVIVPIMLEGLGRLGIILDNNLLKSLSFTTSEYVTLLWAMLMAGALVLARTGFYEVENTIRSLRSQKDELYESNRLKDIFTDIMRHDLLNPIGLIKSYVELLREEDLSDGTMELVDVVSDSAEKASEMIESASQLAKLEKADTLTMLEGDVGHLVKEAFKNHRLNGEKKKITFEIDLNGKYHASFNPALYEVFANLVSNSIKYSPEGSTITGTIEDEGPGWKISIKDQGEGIPDEYKEDVFDRFKRIHKGGVEGTGLGLTIVKKIMDLHNGKVWVEDNPDGGSIFNVLLPK